eukprot:GEMP01061052.1.p1 GENE.GEMP01061052.1~~GEMP01061052.1.p1  ORF type:complete len:178 (+),score=22.62 GEMP01061052.1:85-618(+)
MPFRQKMQNAIPPAYEPLSIALSFQLRYAKTAKRCAYELGDDFYDLEEIRKALGKVTIGEERRIPTLDELVYVAENSANARKGVNRFTLIDHGGIWAVKANYVYDKRPARSGKSSRFSAHQRVPRVSTSLRPLLPPSTAKPWDEGLQNAPQPVSNNAGMRGCSPVVVKKPPPMRPRV